MKFWQAFVIAGLTASLVESDAANLPFALKLLRDGITLVMFWLIWRVFENAFTKDTPSHD